MKYKLTIEFDTLEELMRHLKSEYPVQEALPREDPPVEPVIGDIRSIARYTRRRGVPYTQWETDYMIDHYLTHTCPQIAAALGRTPHSIQQKFQELREKGSVGRKYNRNSPVKNTPYVRD